MASAFPHHPPIDHAPRERTTVTTDDAADVLSILSCDTALRILSVLEADPGTASDVANAVDSSIQTVSYHLDRLRDAGLITPVDTWYSEKGKEMTVYALATERLVVEFGGRPDGPRA